MCVSIWVYMCVYMCVLTYMYICVSVNKYFLNVNFVYLASDY